MPFKVVQTFEKGRPRLSAVPSVWEDKGKLFWPPEKIIKNRARLVRDEQSFPSPNWHILDCTVKRNYLATYNEAEAEIKTMENQTDTDNESVTLATSSQPTASERHIQNENFEDLAQDLLNSNMNVDNMGSYHHEDTLNILPVLDSDQFIAKQNLILQRMDAQDKILNEVGENIKRLSQKVALLSVQMDETLTKIMERYNEPLAVTLLKDAPSVENESFCLQQITNKEQLENFEKALSDKAERTKLKKQLSFLFPPCEGNGVTFGYKLLDSLISREFMCKCSWSGGSRGDISKVALKDFKNFIKFFCEMIRSWDSTFTMGETEKFFKNSLKNAAKRKNIQDKRSSSKRSRRSKPSTERNNRKKLLTAPNTSPNVEADEKSIDNEIDLC